MKTLRTKKVYKSPYIFVHEVELEDNLMETSPVDSDHNPAGDDGELNAPPHTFDDWNTEGKPDLSF